MNFGIAMIWGVAIGTAFGAAFENIPVGIAIGAALGAVYGLFIHPRIVRKKPDRRDP